MTVKINPTRSRAWVPSGYSSEVSITRPSNTTAYAAGDALGIADAGTPANAGSAILTFANIGPAGGEIIVTAADVTIYVGAVPSGMTTFKLHLYDASPTAILDNAAWDLVAGDRAAYLDYILSNTVEDCGATLLARAPGINQQFKLAAGSTSLYGVLTTTGGFTPTSGAVKRVRLRAFAI